MEDSEKSFVTKFAVKYVLSCCAATVAESATYPLDLTKTRLQISNDQLAVGQKPSGSSGMIRTAVGIVRNEGVLHLWQGLTPALYRHFVYSGCRIVIYESLRETLLGKDRHTGGYAPWKAALGGILAGGIAQFLASPTDLIKVQMQMEGRRQLLGLPRLYKGCSDAVFVIVRQQGVLSLWRGWLPNVQRAAVVNMADLATYDEVKHFILDNSQLGDNALTHGLSSICSGLCAAIVGTPADLVKTRVMNDSERRIYRGALDCLLKTIKNEGFLGLYKGFLPIWARMAPWSLTFWVSYEEIRRITGCPSF